MVIVSGNCSLFFDGVEHVSLDPKKIQRSAELSACGVYRYQLRRAWDRSRPMLVVIAVNPSTADGTRDDQTVRKLMGFATRLGYGGSVLANLFAYRATHIKDLVRAANAGVDVVGPDNPWWHHGLFTYARAHAQPVLCAWGSSAKVPSDIIEPRVEVLKAMAVNVGVELRCLGKTKNGSPNHPLMLGYDTPLEVWP